MCTKVADTVMVVNIAEKMYENLSFPNMSEILFLLLIKESIVPIPYKIT